jgi:hypothetical protein
MAATLSETFLTVHPATALWWQQREQCLRCANSVAGAGHEGEGVLRCTAVRIAPRRSRPTLGAYCIDARAGACGPEATLFQEATK